MPVSKEDIDRILKKADKIDQMKSMGRTALVHYSFSKLSELAVKWQGQSLLSLGNSELEEAIMYKSASAYLQEYMLEVAREQQAEP